MQRISSAQLAVLRVFADQPEVERHGYELLKVTGLCSGTLYAMLHRWMQAGLLDSRWEPFAEVAPGRPRRGYYRLSAAGLALAQERLGAAAEQRPLRRQPGSREA